MLIVTREVKTHLFNVGAESDRLLFAMQELQRVSSSPLDVLARGLEGRS